MKYAIESLEYLDEYLARKEKNKTQIDYCPDKLQEIYDEYCMFYVNPQKYIIAKALYNSCVDEEYDENLANFGEEKADEIYERGSYKFYFKKFIFLVLKNYLN